jgi:hypothetical protein
MNSYVCSEKSLQLETQFLEISFVNRSSGIHDYIQSNFRWLHGSKNFPNSSPDSISFVGLAEFTRSRKTKTAIAKPIRKGKQDEGT